MTVRSPRPWLLVLLCSGWLGVICVSAPATGHAAPGETVEASAGDGSPAGVKVRGETRAAFLLRWRETIQRQAQEFPRTVFLEGRPCKDQTGQPCIALTFDDGPGGSTNKILEVLRKHGAKASFFLMGKLAKRHPEAVRRISSEGHAVATHAYTHHDLRKVSTHKAWRDQIGRARSVLEKLIGSPQIYFRPPYGYLTDAEVQEVGTNGMRVIGWTIDSYDWRKGYNRSRKIQKRVLELAYDGAIILLHSGRGKGSRTAKALPAILQTLKERAFRLVTIPELFER